MTLHCPDFRFVGGADVAKHKSYSDRRTLTIPQPHIAAIHLSPPADLRIQRIVESGTAHVRGQSVKSDVLFYAFSARR